MSVHYLVDLENVANHWSQFSREIKNSNATIHFFYSDAITRIDLSGLILHCAYKILAHKTQLGAQSMDMQIVSYAGYLLGRSSGKDRIIIISNDKGYLNTVQFWKSFNPKYNVELLNFKPPSKNSMEKEFDSAIRKEMSKKKMDIAAYDALIKEISTCKDRMKAYLLICKRIGQKNGVALYRDLKSVIYRYIPKNTLPPVLKSASQSC